MPCQNQVRIPSEEEVAVVEDYTICVGKAIPNVIVAASLYGYLYISEDGGDSWRKLKKEFGEIRAVAVMPN